MFSPVQSSKAPQKSLLVFGSMQAPPQFTVSAGHSSVQAPSAQTWFSGQRTPAFAPSQSPDAPQ